MEDQRQNLPPRRFSDLGALGLRVTPGKPRSKLPVLDWKKYQTEAPPAEDNARSGDLDFNDCAVTRPLAILKSLK